MKVLRVGVCGLIAFEVLALGGVLPWAEAILEVGATALFLLWGILALRHGRVEINWTWLYVPLLALGILALVQYAFGITASSYLTKIELLKWEACFVLFFLTIESFRTVDQIEQFVWFLVLLSFFVSLFGIVQHFTFNGKLYWSIPLTRGGAPFGPYANRDHFAGFVELTAPLGLALLLFHACRREKLLLLFLFTVVPVAALILSASRAGILSIFFDSVLLSLLSYAHQVGKKQLLAGIGLGLLAGTFIVWLGVSEAIYRFEKLTPKEISRDRRMSMYRDTWQIFTHHLPVGTGLGTLVVVYPQYESLYDGLVVDHAHNDYLELLADTGFTGGLCGFAFIVLLFREAVNNLRAAQRPLIRAVRAGPLVACSGLLLHSLVDFNLHIPANALLFLLLCALATSPLSNSELNL